MRSSCILLFKCIRKKALTHDPKVIATIARVQPPPNPPPPTLHPLGSGGNGCTQVTATFFTIEGNSTDFAEVNDRLSRPLYERASGFP